MNKKIIAVFIGFHIIFLALNGCDSMAALFHGEKPEDPPAACLVIYSANGASGTAPDSRSVAQGSAIILPGKGNLTYSENVFIGWNENQNGSGTTYASGSSITVNKDVTFYAQWIDGSAPQHTVAFNANGATGGSAPASQTAYGGTSITVPGQGTLVFIGKNFAGWNTRADGSGPLYSAGDPFNVTENITLFAQWSDVPPEGANMYAANSVQTLLDAFQAVNKSSKSGTYIIAITGEYAVQRFALAANAEKTIVLRGSGSPCVLYNGGDDPLFTVPNRITLVLENGIALNGNQKYYPAVKVSLGGTLEMNAGASVTGAKAGGVWVNGGIFNMSGGSICDNYSEYLGSNTGHGGGVFIDNNGTFNFSSGTISDNSAHHSGGGVSVTGATFNMTGGTISGNLVEFLQGGGGVSVQEDGVFNMSNGTICDNRGTYYGGGVAVKKPTSSFTMTGGTITGNTAYHGGGVHINDNGGLGIFTKIGGGIIDDTNSGLGKAASCDFGDKIRNGTAGPSVNMNSLIAGSAGGWE